MPLAESTVVAVVLALDFGDQLLEITQRCPVWIVRSEANDPVIQQVRQESSDECDVTSFHQNVRGMVEEEFLGLIDTIDLHHHGWTAMEVYGCACLPELRAALAAFGALHIEEYPDYFVAHRHVGSLEGNP